MFQQALDLREEGQALKAMLELLKPEDWQKNTPFKNWTINQVVQHLHGSDRMAVLSLKDGDGFKEKLKTPSELMKMMNPEEEGVALLDSWWAYFSEMCTLLGESDPKRRVPWFGPDMGVMMFTTARQMETWSHGQDIFDLFGEARENSNRIKNIVVIGVKTYGWTFANRKLELPGPAPFVDLLSPEGDRWTFNEPADDNVVRGSAVDFCHVVTQGRNIADVSLEVVGEPATRWMSIAQCFAGPPEDPPSPGSRTANF